jgi:recombination protein RecR
MRPLAEPVSNLIDAFSRLPGIGPKSASRLTYFLLRSDGQIALDLAKALEELKAKTLFCSICHNIADSDPCNICADSQRTQTVICVVEEPLDVQAIERTGEFKGLYHVLHGSISPVEGIGPEDLKIRELLQRIQDRRVTPAEGEAAPVPVEEVLVATNPNLEGQATAMYLAQLVKPLGIRVTRLAQGLPTGGDLEYADEVTLSNALSGRREM